MKPIIYLDMDGVCADYAKGALKLLGREDLLLNWPKDEYYISKALGISNQDYHDIISTKKEQFWSELEEYPWFKEMYARLNEIGNVYFCTAPSFDPDCVKGKLMWLQNRFGFDFKKFIFIGDKYHLAKPNCFLIDDFEEQCGNFRLAGGNAILFPQDWNANRDIPDRVNFVLSSIQNGLNLLKSA